MKKIVFLVLCMFFALVVNGQTASVSKIWLEHNAVKDGVRGINVHIRFGVQGMKGVDGKAIAYFDSPQGVGVKDRNGKYCTNEGTVCTSVDFCPGYPNSTYNDLSAFIPLDELHLYSGNRTYYCRVYLQNLRTGRFLTHSAFVSFNGSGGSNSGGGNSNVNNNGNRKSLRQDLGNGEYCDYSQNADGSWNTLSHTICPICHGSKQCLVCFGQGGVYNRAYGYWTTCVSCMGTKACQNCHGTGYITIVGRTQNGISIGYDQNGRVASSGGGSSDHSSTSHRSSRSSKSSSCSYCHGTGVSPNSNTGGSLPEWVAYYNSQGTKCPYCGSYSKHLHDRCPSCNVPR